MLWESVNDACDVCECGSMVTSDCKLSTPCCNTFRHDPCREKENIQQDLNISPLKNELDLSLYSGTSPERVRCRGASPHFQRQRVLTEEHDANSQDSGYGASCPNDGKFYQFAKSLGVTPSQNCLPNKTGGLSFGSMESMDDEFLEFTDLEQPLNENSQLPTDFTTLISKTYTSSTTRTSEESPVYNQNQLYRPPLRRHHSENGIQNTPNSSKVRSCLFKKDHIELKSFKRPEPPMESRTPQTKRFKIENEESESNDSAAVPEVSCPVLQRSISATEESIKYALQRSSTEPDLIGDFTKAFCLPLTVGRHQDLKSITPSTLALLMRGEFTHTSITFKVIDCRYPYEYDGGHINGAINLFTKDQVLDTLLNTKISTAINSEMHQSNILVFHCEFSSERGPNLYRFLRKLDRIRNSDVYPALHYPEMYLLDGGYKNFYEQYSELCVPEAYKPMLHPAHSNDLRHFRAKSKTWNTERFRNNSKGNLKRLGFF